MKRQDNIITIETLEDVSDMYHVHRDTANFSGVHIQFAEYRLRRYWESLVSGDSYTLCFFDFKAGVEYGPGLTRDESNIPLMAAKFIARTGAALFNVRAINGDNYQAVQFTKVPEEKAFVFKDTVDYPMYISAKAYMNERRAEYNRRVMERELARFIGTEDDTSVNTTTPGDG